MGDHLATLIDDFRRFDGEIAVVRYQGNRRRVTTYGELARLAGRFAALLAARGIVASERVLIWAENSAEWIAAFHGCMLRGVLAVPLDAFGTAEFVARVAKDVSPKLVLGDALLLAKLAASRPGRTPAITAETVRRIVRKTTREKPEAATHWSTRSMAKAVGVSKATLRASGRRRLEAAFDADFKLSNDPHFVEKLLDVVGLYLDPPEHAMVLCADEKTSIQALDRTQRGLPIHRGRCGTMSHD